MNGWVWRQKYYALSLYFLLHIMFSCNFYSDSFFRYLSLKCLWLKSFYERMTNACKHFALFLVFIRAMHSKLLFTMRLSPSSSEKRDWMEKRETLSYPVIYSTYLQNWKCRWSRFSSANCKNCSLQKILGRPQTATALLWKQSESQPSVTAWSWNNSALTGSQLSQTKNTKTSCERRCEADAKK